LLFNSLPFLVFLPVFLVLYFATRGRARLWVCLLSSYVFYGWWDWRFLGLIGLSTVVDYFVGLGLAASDDPKRRKRLVLVSLCTNLGLLATFKYFNFFADSFAALLSTFGFEATWTTVHIVLPVGISFYTFQTLSYTLDLYWEKIEVERSLLRFATFVAFFPQLVAGPIVRAGELLPQLREDHPFDAEKFVSGFGQALWGFFKKVVVADSLAIVVDARFGFESLHSPTSLLIAVLCYAFQIYCDFSGYSDIAIGIARMVGFDFPRNFAMPYFSRDFSEFWRRWHISLSGWLRDYLYIPLGGNRHGVYKTYRNLCITMLLGGLWHGAAWTFVVWGALHGLYLVLQRLLQGPWRSLCAAVRVPDVVRQAGQMAVVFALTCFAWIFFRSQTFGDAGAMIAKLGLLFDPTNGVGLDMGSVTQKFYVVKAFFVIGLLLACEIPWRVSARLRTRINHSIPARVVLFAIGLVLISLLGTFRENAFIYFQF